MPHSSVEFCRYDRLQERAAAFLREWGAQGEVLVVGASRPAVDDLIRSVCDTALIGIRRCTLRDLVASLADPFLISNDVAPARQIAREALAASVARRAELNYLKDVARFPGFARALARTLQDLRLNGVAREAVASAGRSGPDLGILLELYEAELADLRLADYPARVRLAIEAAAACTAVPLLLLDVDARSTAERALLDRLAERAPASLELRLGREPLETRDNLSSLQRYVLSGEPAPQRETDSSVRLFSASSEALECVEIARAILHSGLPFDATAVLLRHPSRYRPLVDEAFARAGIPAWYSRSARRPDPAGAAFLSLLRCREEGLTASRFAEYLSLGQMPREEGEIREPLRWERLLTDAAVIGGVDRWERRLKGTIDAKLKQYETNPNEALSRRIDSLNALAGFALPIVRRLAELPHAATWGDWLDTLHDLSGHVLRDARSIREVLELLAPMSDIGPVSLPDVLLVLERHLATTVADSDADRYGSVFVGSIEEARGLSFEHVFIPGLNEGLFPRLVREDPLLLDSQREALSIPERIDDGELLRIAVACASRSATLSWSRLDLATGRERVASFFAFETVKAARGGDIEITKLLDEAKSGSDTRIGWSAPSDPRAAIDEVEYDLAAFRNAKGAGAFAWIKELSRPAARSIESRLARWSKEWTSADGLAFTDVHVSGLLKQWQPSSRSYSVSKLQQFARCPYRFLLSAVYGFQPLEQPEAPQRMEPSIRGQLVHEVQARLMVKLETSGQLPVDEENLESAVTLMNDILTDAAERLKEEIAPAIPQVWESGVASVRADLTGYLHHIAANETEWTPIEFEKKFDTTILDRYKLNGQIDLIERHITGALRVTDHKTGALPLDPPRTTGGGETLQPLLYALATEQILGELPAEARLFYSTLKGNYKPVRLAVDRDAARRLLDTMENWIDRPFLPASPRAEGCVRCEYVPICGPYEELRVARKPAIDIRDLAEIRKTP